MVWKFGGSGIEGLPHGRGAGSPKPLPVSDLAFPISSTVIATRRHVSNDSSSQIPESGGTTFIHRLSVPLGSALRFHVYFTKAL